MLIIFESCFKIHESFGDSQRKGTDNHTSTSQTHRCTMLASSYECTINRYNVVYTCENVYWIKIYSILALNMSYWILNSFSGDTNQLIGSFFFNKSICFVDKLSHKYLCHELFLSADSKITIILLVYYDMWCYIEIPCKKRIDKSTEATL